MIACKLTSYQPNSDITMSDPRPDEAIPPLVPDLDDFIDDNEEEAEAEFTSNPNEDTGSRLLKNYAIRGKLDKFKTCVELYGLDVHRKFKQGISYLHHAAFGGNVDILRYLIKQFNLDPLIRSDFRQTPLHFAALAGNVPVIRFIIRDLRYTADQINCDKIAPLHYACLKRKFDAVRCLLEECKAQVTASVSGAFPIHFASKGGDPEVVEYLAEHHAGCSVTSQTNNGLTSLDIACFEGCKAVVKLLIDKYDCFKLSIAGVRKLDSSQFTPLLFSLIGKDSSKAGILKLLVSRLVGHSGKYKHEVSLFLTQVMKSPIASKLDNQAAKLLRKLKLIDSCKDVNAYVKVVFLGNSGAGKTTLVEGLKTQGNLRILAPIVGRACSMNEVKCLTAGVVPSKLERHINLGNVVVHDFAGQLDYYSSHQAVLQNFVQSGAVFVLFVNLIIKDELQDPSISKWISLISSAKLQNSTVIVVASHVDELQKSIVTQRIEYLERVLKRHGINFEIVGLNCRKFVGEHFSTFSKALSAACFSVRSNYTATDEEFELHCQMLYAFLESLQEPFIKLVKLIQLAECTEDYCLPEDHVELQMCISSLHSRGLVFFVFNERCPNESWVVVDIEMLLSNVNGILFAPKEFEEYHDIASNTGKRNLLLN